MMAKSTSSCRLLVFVFALFVCSASSSCPGTPTNLPITDATAMTLVANVTNGQMFTAGPSDNSLRVVHVWGTAYEMGYAQGLLLGAVLRDVYGVQPFYQCIFVTLCLGTARSWHMSKRLLKPTSRTRSGCSSCPWSCEQRWRAPP
jgi:hypothetical protein